MTAVFLTALISMAVFMFGTVLALIWYLRARIDRLEDKLGARLDRFGAMLESEPTS
jgi:ABC-type transport system involved in cytochrome c biogenesis permease subunit